MVSRISYSTNIASPAWYALPIWCVAADNRIKRIDVPWQLVWRFLRTGLLQLSLAKTSWLRPYVISVALAKHERTLRLLLLLLFCNEPKPASEKTSTVK